MDFFNDHNDFEGKFGERKSLLAQIFKDDELSNFPTEALKYIEEGVLEYFIPIDEGGKFKNLQQIFIMGRCLARRNVSTAIALGQSFLGSIPLWFSGSEESKKKLVGILKSGGANCLALTELEHGSDLVGSECEIKDLKISGTKWCINNATLGKAMSVLCKDDSSLSLVFVHKNSKNFTNLIKIKTHGIKGADISGITFNSYPVEEQDFIGKRGRGLEVIAKTMQISRTLCASFSLGASDSTIRDTINFAMNRKLYNKPLMQIESVRVLLSKSIAKSLICEALSLSATRMASFKPELMSLYSSVVKTFVPMQIEEQIKMCAEVLGARHYLREEDFYIFQKNLRDHSVVSLFDGSFGVNLSLLFPILKKLNILKGCPLTEKNEILNISEELPALNFNNFKLSLRTYDYVISEFFSCASKLGETYFSVSILTQRFDDIAQSIEEDLDAHSYAARCLTTEFIKVFSAMNFILFCSQNNVLPFINSSDTVDKIVLSLFDEDININFDDDVFTFYGKNMVSLFKLEINE